MIIDLSQVNSVEALATQIKLHLLARGKRMLFWSEYDQLICRCPDARPLGREVALGCYDHRVKMNDLRADLKEVLQG